MLGCHRQKTVSKHIHHSRPCSEKTGDRYQAYCTMYKTHAMATCHAGAGCPVDRDIDLHIEDMEGINTGLDNDKESTSGSDTTIAFRGSEEDDHPSELIPSNQAKLTAVMREIHDLHQQV